MAICDDDAAINCFLPGAIGKLLQSRGKNSWLIKWKRKIGIAMFSRNREKASNAGDLEKSSHSSASLGRSRKCLAFNFHYYFYPLRAQTFFSAFLMFGKRGFVGEVGAQRGKLMIENYAGDSDEL
jgi:hypothetical protein